MTRLEAQFFVSPNGEVRPKAKTLSYQDRKRIIDRDGGVCQECGGVVRLFKKSRSDVGVAAIDHIFPRCRGGQNTDNNLRLLCFRCNGSKGPRTSVYRRH